MTTLKRRLDFDSGASRPVKEQAPPPPVRREAPFYAPGCLINLTPSVPLDFQGRARKKGIGGRSQSWKIPARGLDRLGERCYCGSVATQTTDFMTARQAAKQIGVHFTTIYRWIDAGTILSINFGGILFIPRSEVERLNKRRNGEAARR